MCEVLKKGFPEVMLDNDEVFINQLIGVVDSCDELCSLEIVKVPTAYHFRIAPSIPRYLEPLLHEILNFHNMFGIRLDLGKSMKVSGSINFSIEIK